MTNKAIIDICEFRDGTPADIIFDSEKALGEYLAALLEDVNEGRKERREYLIETLSEKHRELSEMDPGKDLDAYIRAADNCSYIAEQAKELDPLTDGEEALGDAYCMNVSDIPGMNILKGDRFAVAIPGKGEPATYTPEHEFWQAHPDILGIVKERLPKRREELEHQLQLLRDDYGEWLEKGRMGLEPKPLAVLQYEQAWDELDSLPAYLISEQLQPGSRKGEGGQDTGVVLVPIFHEGDDPRNPAAVSAPLF